MRLEKIINKNIWPKDITFIDSDYFLYGYSINHYRNGEIIDEGYYLRGRKFRKNKIVYRNTSYYL